MKFCVVGTGYVGLSIAVLLSQKYDVAALDIAKERVDLINKKKGRDRILKYIEEQLKKRKSKAKIRFFDDYPLMRRYWSWLMK